MFGQVSLFFILLISLLSNAYAADWEEIDLDGLSVLRYIPSAGNPKSRALLVVLHGCAQKNAHLRDTGNLIKASEAYNSVILLPLVPNGGVIAGCWDFYGEEHTRVNRMNGALLGAITLSLADKNLGIDPAKVFISGLSSGAGEALVLACLAPDLIRGVGLVAGVAIAHEARDISRPKLTATQSKEFCQKLAGSNVGKLAGQRVSIIFGSEDRLVNSDHSKLVAQMYELLHSKARQEAFSIERLEGENSKGSGTLYLEGARPFMSLIENEGLGHAWPAGVSSVRAPFVSGDSIDYPSYLLSFLLL